MYFYIKILLKYIYIILGYENHYKFKRVDYIYVGPIFLGVPPKME
jgi:hypothetical protein